MTQQNPSSQIVVRRKVAGRMLSGPEKPAPKTVAERARAARERKRAAGQPAVAAFDRMLREIVFKHYQAGLPCDAPDLVRATTEELTASGEHSGRGCRATVQTLMAQAGGVDVV
ncbi:hypothetical protein FIU28_17060 [Tardiphaga sp. vice154]|uniref:hypothetical protein n=1 Tax=Tardiphaga sp. vice154 TaxID=2592814 RepID=UPI00116563EF|nr:hypothetical protein [Tardiphaga sp. vice154]QDM22670.1 hypothetical protein FIU28_17060 [Tardiphaga sp. vice154]